MSSSQHTKVVRQMVGGWIEGKLIRGGDNDLQT
jgi:hypothetical protein